MTPPDSADVLSAPAMPAVACLWLLTFVKSLPDAWLLPTAQRVAWLALVVWAVAASRP